MNDDHVMVDLETTHTVATAGILSIGAGVFKGPAAGKTFYTAVDYQSCKDLGLTESASTIAWWQRQSKEARQVFNDPSAVPIQEALRQFSNFIYTLSEPKVWGNGANFDNAILENAYSLCGREAPWKFYNNRCYRTAMAGLRFDDSNRTGAHHHALHDALTQAERLLKHRPELIR